MIRQLAKNLIRRYYAHEVGHSAAALTYYLLFSFFPFLVFISGLLSMLNIPRSEFYAQLSLLLPSDIIGIMDAFLENVGEVNAHSLLVFGIVFMIYFPIRATSWLIRCIYDFSDGEVRGGLRQACIVAIFSISLPVVLLLSMLIALLSSNLLTFLSEFIPLLSHPGIRLWGWLRFLILAGIIFLVLCMLYRMAPKGHLSFRCIFPGALLSTLSWLVISMLFSFYVDNIRNYSLIYGSLGAIMVLMLWLYFTSVLLLFGAEFNQALMDVRGIR